MDFVQIENFLGTQLRRELYDYCLSREEDFLPSMVGQGDGELSVEYRNSLALKDLGPFHTVLESKASLLVPQLTQQLGVSEFDVSDCEIEVVAHNHGSFYKRHVDTFVADERDPAKGDRILSLVYYFHGQEKRFEGGALRIYPDPIFAGPTTARHFDIQPRQDTAVVFSSWMLHEVIPVRCDSRRFADSRFAVNCWISSRSVS